MKSVRIPVLYASGCVAGFVTLRESEAETIEVVDFVQVAAIATPTGGGGGGGAISMTVIGTLDTESRKSLAEALKKEIEGGG